MKLIWVLLIKLVYLIILCRCIVYKWNIVLNGVYLMFLSLMFCKLLVSKLKIEMYFSVLIFIYLLLLFFFVGVIGGRFDFECFFVFDFCFFSWLDEFLGVLILFLNCLIMFFVGLYSVVIYCVLLLVIYFVIFNLCEEV